jgi:hypothetical protein
MVKGEKMNLEFTKKELAIIQELIDLHDMYYCKELSNNPPKNPILETINDNPECFGGQTVTHKDFKGLVDKLAKYHNRGRVE